MAARLFYFARPYHWQAGALVAGDAMPFLCAMDAEDGGALLLKMSDGVAVYQQHGDPDFDLWEDPEILAVLGSVPEEVRQAA